MKTKIALAIVLLLAVIGGLAAIKGSQFKLMINAGKAYVTPPETVSSAAAREEKWPETLSAIGSMNAAQGVTITPDIPGTVREIAFESGAVVAKGDLLVKLDVSTETAQWEAADAQLKLADLNLQRNKKLFQDKTISQAELDTAEASVRQLSANAGVIRATIEKKTIRAPFAGRLGIRQVNLGQYLDAGKPIVSLQALSPIYADFSLPQQDLAQLKTGMRVQLATDAYPERVFEGTLTAINPDLDAVTRSIGLQASLENADQSLRPGMFAKIEVVLPQEQNVLVIPATSILSAPYGDSVYVIEPATSTNGTPAGLAVRQQFVRTGRARGDMLSVESGLKPGERVVTSGVFKLRNGMSVVESNEPAPKAVESPRPANS